MWTKENRKEKGRVGEKIKKRKMTWKRKERIIKEIKVIENSKGKKGVKEERRGK